MSNQEQEKILAQAGRIGRCFKIPHHDTDDVTIAAQLRALEIIAGAKDESKLTPVYMRSCIRNFMRDLWRESRPELRALPLDAPVVADDNEETFADQLSDSRPGPEDLAIASEQQALLHKALASLPMEDSDLIRAHFGLGTWSARTVRELAEELGQAKSTISDRIVRLQKQIRTFIFGGQLVAAC
jgi:RNA polymerase sigma factor (sigma-70 family)